MDAEALIEQLARRDVRLGRRGEKLVCDAPRGALTPALREEIRRLKPELLALLAAREHAAREPTLSRSQRRIAALSELLPGYNAAGNIPLGIRLVGALDEGALAGALQAIVARHEVFRAAIGDGPGRRPALRDSVNLHIETHDLRGEDARARRARIDALVAAPFDLREAPLLRVALLRIGDHERLLVIVTHVMVFDGRSTPIFLDELATHYRAALAGRDANLPAPGRYSEYAREQRSRLSEGALAQQRAGWREALAGTQLVTGLVARRPESAVPVPHTLGCAKIELELPTFLADSARACARALGATLFHTLLAAYQVLFHRYTLQPSVAIGTIVSSRRGVASERMIGSFANNILIRGDFAAETRFADLVRQVRTFAQGTLARQELPFEQLLMQLDAPLRRLPLFRVMFVLHQLPPEHGGLNLPGVSASLVHVPKLASNHVLNLVLSDRDGRISGALEYNTQLVARETAGALIERYQQVLRRVCDDPDAPLAALPRYVDPAATAWAQDPQRSGCERRAPEWGADAAAIVEAWERALDVQGAAPADDFFAVGGHSLLALSLLSSLERRFAVSGLLDRFRNRPTLATLIEAVAARRRAAR